MKWLLTLPARLKFWAVAIAAGLAGLLAIYAKITASARARIKAKQDAATIKAIVRGTEGAADATADLKAGKTPQQIKEANDAAWR